MRNTEKPMKKLIPTNKICRTWNLCSKYGLHIFNDKGKKILANSFNEQCLPCVWNEFSIS